MPGATLRKIACGPSVAWSELRQEIGERLHGNAYTTVPLLDEAKTFDMLTVYVKRNEHQGCFTRLCSAREYQMVGWLRDLVKVSKCTEQRLRSLLPRELPIKVGGDAVFEFTTENLRLDREAIIRIYNLSIETSDVVSIRPGEIYVDLLAPGLQNVETVYILSEVIFCRRFYFFLRFEKREIVLNLAYERLPIAFRSVKFYIGQDGGLILMHEAKICNKASKVKWSACGIENDEVEDKPPLPSDISNLKVVGYSKKMIRVDTSRSCAGCSRHGIPLHVKNPDADLSRDHKLISETPLSTEISKSARASRSSKPSRNPSLRV